ncbi:MAG: glycosyltransferase, partial [Alcaligenaceae bacterium]
MSQSGVCRRVRSIHPRVGCGDLACRSGFDHPDYGTREIASSGAQKKSSKRTRRRSSSSSCSRTGPLGLGRIRRGFGPYAPCSTAGGVASRQDRTFGFSSSSKPLKSKVGSTTVKVLFVLEKLSGGGAEEVSLNWIDGLQDSGIDVEIAVTGDSLANDAYSVGGMDVHWISRIRGKSSKLRSLRRTIRQTKPDAIVSSLTYQNLLVLVAAFGLRLPAIVLSEHNVPSVYLREQGISQRVQLALSKILYRRASLIIGVSHAVITDLRCNFRIRTDRAVLLRNAVTHTVSERKPVDGQRKIHLLIPARLVPQKRPQRVFDIADTLIGRGHTVSVTFVGEGAQLEPVSELARSRSYIVDIYPWCTDWERYASEDTVLLLASRVEGLANVLIQSFERGVPAVACSSALGVGDSLIVGITGYLATRDTVGSYADAIE